MRGKEAAQEKDLSGAAYSYGYDEEYQQRYLKRVEQKLNYLNRLLKTAEGRKGSGEEEVKTNITDHEREKGKGPHGYIQGYNGIAVADDANPVIVAAEVLRSGSDQVTVMREGLTGQMHRLNGKDKPLKGAMVVRDRGYCTEQNLKEAEEGELEVLIPDQQFRKRDEPFAGRPWHGGKQRYTAEDVVYEEGSNRYRCPLGKERSYKGHVKL